MNCDCDGCGANFDRLALIDGLCGICRIGLKVEVSTGYRKLERYLDKWARFREWEVAHR